MNYVVDPDVFQASFFEIACMAALNEIADKFLSHDFFCDAEGVLEREYRKFFNEKYQTDPEHIAVVLLQRMLFDAGNDKNTISSQNPIRPELESLGCSQPVEPDLLGMLANARDRGLVLAMVGHDADYLRQRGLHQENIRWQVRNRIPWLDIQWLGKARPEIPRNDYSDQKSFDCYAKLFEAKAALWLQDHDPSLRCMTPPAEGEVGNEQIDVYGYRDTGTGRTVVIGECKLRREGNEKKAVSVEEIQQLRRKVIACKRYDNNHHNDYEGILITNAQDIDHEAREFIISESRFRIKVLSVNLKKSWEQGGELRIISGTWQDFSPNAAH